MAMAMFFDADDAAQLVSAAIGVRDWLRDGGIAETEIRVQVTDCGAWSLHTGDASYDQDHRGYWGAGHIAADHDDRTVRMQLASMVDDACECACYSMAGFTVPERSEIAHALNSAADEDGDRLADHRAQYRADVRAEQRGDLGRR